MTHLEKSEDSTIYKMSKIVTAPKMSKVSRANLKWQMAKTSTSPKVLQN